MNWFDILKNQVASTTEAAFELDFNQPMVEAEESKCKPKLLALAKRLQSFSKDGYTRIVMENLDSTSEETCCRAIHFFKVIDDNAGGWGHNETPRLGAWKNNFGDYRGINGIRSYITQIVIGHYDYLVSLWVNVPNEASDEEVERIGQEFKEVSDRLFVL